ncbi:MAG: hypothetical protein J0L88_04455 [Xanthomonadales bacterium]|nr:hypothetical protein [Xanthomonadales bacterium]
MPKHSMPTRVVSAVLALSSTAAGPACAAIYAVGDIPGCTHATIQSAINAAEANPGEDFIRIPHDRVWNNLALSVNTSQILSFEGYWSDCNTIDTSGARTTLDGAGGGAAPVLRIEGSGHNVNFDAFTIRNGDVAGTAGKGGGIWYRGNGTLFLANTSVINNTAGLGGGLYLEGTGVDAVVVIGGNVGITGNTARASGGGVFAEAVRLYMTSPNSIIAFNEATGYTLAGNTFGGFGGGLVVNNTTSFDGYATIGSAGVGAFGAIHGNTARYGGGVAVLGEDGSDRNSRFYLYQTQAGIPAKITQNFASVGGGALYLARPSPVAVLHNAALEDNAAVEGSAIYLDADGDVRFNFDWENLPLPVAPVACTAGSPCGRIAGNVDQDAQGQPTGGAVIHAGNDAWRLDLGCSVSAVETATGPRGIVIDGNRGGRLFDLSSMTFACLSSLLITGNQASQALIRSSTDVATLVQDSTIAGNAIGGSAVFDLGDFLNLRRTLIWQPGTLSKIGSGTLPSVEWIIASEAASLGGGPGAIVADPRFVDPARGDWRLRAASPAIDYAPPVMGDDRDVFGLPRDQNMPVIPAAVPERVRDTGAFERQSFAPIVLNGDFGGDTNLWSLPVGHSGDFQTVNAPGSAAGTGSAQVAGTSSAGRLLGYAQCMHLPGPGTWALNGSARSESAQLSNPTGLIWELRLDGGEGCVEGPITNGGVHAIGTASSADQWVRPGSPALISVNEAAWTHNTSLTVIMAVYPYAGGTAFNGLFDRITLEWAGPADDVIFRDGFDGP